jgi:hypothetical protein
MIRTMIAVFLLHFTKYSNQEQLRYINHMFWYETDIVTNLKIGVFYIPLLIETNICVEGTWRGRWWHVCV